mgnify:CR=1 FL=1
MTNLVDVNDVYALFKPNGTAQLHVADIDQLPRVKYKAPRAKWKLGNYGKGTCSRCNFTQNGVWDYDHYQRFCGVCGAEMELEVGE